MDLGLAGKRAIVLGASRGMGDCATCNHARRRVMEIRLQRRLVKTPEPQPQQAQKPQQKEPEIPREPARTVFFGPGFRFGMPGAFQNRQR